MKIESIIYETTRGIYSVEDKLSIATIFIFCFKVDSDLFSKLLYTSDHVKFIAMINDKYSKYEVDFSIRLSDKNVRDSFYKTLEKVKQKYDKDGFYKALYDGDEFAIAIRDIINFSFSMTNAVSSTVEQIGQLKMIF